MIIDGSDYYFCVRCGETTGFPVSPDHEPEAYVCDNCKSDDEQE